MYYANKQISRESDKVEVRVMTRQNICGLSSCHVCVKELFKHKYPVQRIPVLTAVSLPAGASVCAALRWRHLSTGGGGTLSQSSVSGSTQSC